MTEAALRNKDAPPRSHLEPCGRGIADAEPCPEELGRAVEPRRRRLALIACVLASSMGFIDGSALTVALPALRDDLGADIGVVQWVLNAYVLALAAFVLIGGVAADVYGKARMLTFGVGGFAIASAVWALAPNAEILIGARFAQGLAAAAMTPASLALIGAVFPKAMRNQAIGVWAAASALTTAGGPILGGWLTETFGWQAIFWLNPPLAAASIVILRAARLEDHPDARPFDLIGAGILALALGLLAWGLSAIGPGEAGASEGGIAVTPKSIAALIAGLGGLFLYWRWENRTATPMTPPRLFVDRAFTGINLATFCLYTALSVMFFLLPFELIDRRGLSASMTGVAFLPFTLAMGFLAGPAGAMADRFGVRVVLSAGGVVAATGFLLFILLREAGVAIGVFLPVGLLGLAFAAMVGPLTAAVMSAVDDKDEGLASGVNNAASRIAQLIGVALAAGLAGLAAGYAVAFGLAAALSAAAAAIVWTNLPPTVRE